MDSIAITGDIVTVQVNGVTVYVRPGVIPPGPPVPAPLPPAQPPPPPAAPPAVGDVPISQVAVSLLAGHGERLPPGQWRAVIPAVAIGQRLECSVSDGSENIQVTVRDPFNNKILTFDAPNLGTRFVYAQVAGDYYMDVSSTAGCRVTHWRNPP